MPVGLGPECRGDEAQFEWGKEIAPGVTAIDASGHHRPCSLGIQSAGKAAGSRMSWTSPIIPVFSRHSDWSAVFDMDADKARATRRRILDMAATERTQLAFFHAPFPATGHVRKDGNGFEWRNGAVDVDALSRRAESARLRQMDDRIVVHPEGGRPAPRYRGAEGCYFLAGFEPRSACGGCATAPVALSSA